MTRSAAPASATVPVVSLLIVSYNGRRHIRRLLRSLGMTAGVAFEVIVVDNRSRRIARRALVRRAEKGMIDSLTLLGRNTLFAPGVNTAARVSDPRSRYVLLLNPDVVIRDGEWLAKLIGVHRSGATGLGLAGAEPWPRADGYCLIIDRELFTSFGGVSEDYHWWWGVTKLQADLLRAGHSVQAVRRHDALLTHVGGGSGKPPLEAQGMDTEADTIRAWFGDRHISVIEAL